MNFPFFGSCDISWLTKNNEINWSRELLEITKPNSETEVENLRKKNPSKSRKSENISLQERLADLKEVQMEALEEAQKRKQDFMKTMLEKQRQISL